jgi:hypothetical protein
MEEIDRGHVYLLDNLDGDDKQTLVFVKRIGSKYPFNAPPAYQGTTCQEVINANIARVNYLQKQSWCLENVVILFCLKIALWAFEFRASRIKGHFLFVNPLSAWKKAKCTHCGHIGCRSTHNT